MCGPVESIVSYADICQDILKTYFKTLSFDIASKIKKKTLRRTGGRGLLIFSDYKHREKFQGVANVYRRSNVEGAQWLCLVVRRMDTTLYRAFEGLSCGCARSVCIASFFGYILSLVACLTR